MKQNIWVDLFKSLVFAAIATAFSYILGMKMGWITSVSMLDVFAVFTSYSCTWMCVTQNHLNFPLGIASSVAYGVSFIGYGLISSAISSFYLVPVLFVGWWYWWRGKDIVTPAKASNNYGAKWTNVEVPVTNLKFNRNLAFYVIISIVTWAILWQITRMLNATLPMYDSAILILSIIAQYLLQGKKIENWYIWVFMNCICIYTYFTTGAFLFGVQYVFFIGTDIMGLVKWWKSKNSTPMIKKEFQPQ